MGDEEIPHPRDTHTIFLHEKEHSYLCHHVVTIGAPMRRFTSELVSYCCVMENMGGLYKNHGIIYTFNGIICTLVIQCFLILKI